MSDVRGTIDAARSQDPPQRPAVLQGSPTPNSESRVQHILVSRIMEPGWRTPVDATDPAFRALRASVRASGVVQPLLVRPVEGGYEVVSGMRRLRAARDTGQGTVPAVIRDLGELEAVIGALDAVRRAPIDQSAREALRERLLEEGMSGSEAEALLTTVPGIEEPSEPEPIGGNEPEPASHHAAAADAAATVAVTTPEPETATVPSEPEGPVLRVPEAMAQAPAPAPAFPWQPPSTQAPADGDGFEDPREGTAATSPPPAAATPVEETPDPRATPRDGSATDAVTAGTATTPAVASVTLEAFTASEAGAQPAAAPPHPPEPEVLAGEPDPSVIPITLPAPAREGPDTSAEAVVHAPPSAPPADTAQVPLEPVTAHPALGAPRSGLVKRVVGDPRTYATAGTFLAVWAAVFDLVLFALGVTNTRLLLGGAVAIAIGVILAIASLVIPSRTL